MENKVEQKTKELTIGNSLLLISVFSLIFIVPIFPLSWHKAIYNALFMIVFFMSVLSLDQQKYMFKVAVIIAVVELASFIMDLPLLLDISRLLNFVFFIYIVIHLIIQVARTKNVTASTILESINGYLLMGLVFSIVIAFVADLNPSPFSFPAPADSAGNFSIHVYFSFVTLSTLGYGDITPQSPTGQSLATLIAVTGQIYVAVIIAMLVGKFSGQMKD